MESTVEKWKVFKANKYLHSLWEAYTQATSSPSKFPNEADYKFDEFLTGFK